MLEFAKQILVRVSFDAQLFQKELNKALKWLNDAEEIKRFKEWCIQEFGTVHPKIITKTFNQTKKA